MKIYVVIPIHNRKNITRDCLLSLRRQASRDFQVIVVDDGSTDGSGDMVSGEFPEAVLLRGDGNLWWTGAVNLGVRFALEHGQPEDAVLLLNDDLIVPPDYIATLIRLAGQHPDTLIGSAVVDSDDPDRITWGGTVLDWNRAGINHINIGKKLSSFPADYCVEVSTHHGRGVLIPLQVYRKVGLYNERHYPQYGDIEFPVRAKKAGYKLLMCYGAVVCTHPTEPIYNPVFRYTLRSIKPYFWSTRSASDLRFRFWFAYDTSTNLLQGTRFLIYDLVHVVRNFIRDFNFS